ncbi:MAG TPA: thiamine pyrophosphate-dependent enzyme, partial [Candidatus Eremiobacteraeota bacterium]|nr:thiamine pyrophosphate-dependent enzyme [Candidatus Eremiobacteraeota bacterium]
AGARTLVAMKHVGLNVAADPLFTMSYIGVNGGFIIISADDPDMHSSQNEQDNRYYAKAAKIPMLEPSNSQEAKDFVGLALTISEEFDTPVLLRITTRISHSNTVVELKERKPYQIKDYKKNVGKNVMIPANAKKRHIFVEERIKKLQEYSEKTPVNFIQEGKGNTGIITSSISYQYVKEVFPEAPVLKLGMTYPLPFKLIEKFKNMVKEIYIVEELEPYMETEIKARGIDVTGKDRLPLTGELNPSIIANCFGIDGFTSELTIKESIKIPARPPVLCPGCPHRGLFYNISRMKLHAFGDIGCYTLGMLPPLNALDTCLCMGASICVAHGMDKALGREITKKSVAVIGDSTFIHSGITGLIDIVYNKGTSTVVILDNSITAMTGRQEHPSTGKTLKGESTKKLDLFKLCKSIGVDDTIIVDAFDVKGIKNALKHALDKDEPSVIIVKGLCTLIDKSKKKSYRVEPDKCIKCWLCLKVGCPAISKGEISSCIDAFLCRECGVCASVCPKEAIIK